jgi:predicted acylesterase/phospholipase RssA
MAKKRVALVLSGGVSLGSYIAGALDELLRRMEASNEYEIDVITGASAGATTAAIIAHGLLYRGSATGITTLLKKTWVEDIDAYDLLDSTIAPDIPLSVLNNQRLKQIATDALSPPNGEAQSSPLCAERLQVALTITNIEGLSYESHVQMTTDGALEPFIQDRFAEQETFTLEKSTQADSPIWQRMAEVALASSALPLAFPPVKLRRKLVAEGGPDVPEWANSRHYIHMPSLRPDQAGLTDATFLYADGGTFNNLPIDLAWYHVLRIDRTLGEAERIVIIVDPSKDQLRQVHLDPPEQRPAYNDPVHYLLGLVGAMYSESSAIQFDREILVPSLEAGRNALLRGAIPGIDRADVEMLKNVALVIPKQHQPRLIGSHLVFALAAFVDQSFREYDFKRGQEDAALVATNVLKIPALPTDNQEQAQPTQRPSPSFRYPSSYQDLATIPSNRDSRYMIRQLFEERLSKRLSTVIQHFKFTGPWWLRGLWFILRYPLSWYLPRKGVSLLPKYW